MAALLAVVPAATSINKIDNIEAKIAAIFAVEVAVSVEGVGRFTAAATVVVLERKKNQPLVFPEKSILTKCAASSIDDPYLGTCLALLIRSKCSNIRSRAPNCDRISMNNRSLV